MSVRSPLASDATSAANNARGLRSDSNDSTDSGFGDESLPQDEYIQQRLQKMNTLMGFGDAPSIDELAVTPALGSTPPPQPPTYGGPVALPSSLSPPPPFSAQKKPALTAYERLQALSLNDGPAGSTLQLVDDAASLPTPDAARFFGAAAAPTTAREVAFATNGTFMADDDDDDNDDDDAYVVTWEGGQLGLLFKANASDQVVIRRVNKKGTALGLHCARAGDVLIGLNGISVHGVPFLDVIAQLQRPRFPLRLEFEPMKFNALPPSFAATPAVVLPPPPPYIPSSNGAVSPTSSAGTIEVADQDASYVVVPRDAGLDGGRTTPRQTPVGAEYDVVWDDGPLGCGLKHRNGVPTVKTASSAGVSASVAQIRAGDVLLLINGYRTLDIGFKSAITMLQRAPKPIYLRFRRQAPAVSTPTLASVPTPVAPVSTPVVPALTPASVPTPTPTPTPAAPTPVVPTSMTPTPAPVPTSIPVPTPTAGTGAQYHVVWSDGPLGIQIKAGARGLVYVSRLTGAGNPAMTQQIAPGDIFVRIADVDVAARGIAGAFELLKTVAKPVVLVFEKPDTSATVVAPTIATAAPALVPPPALAPAPQSPSGPVPSFRKLREQQAAAKAAAGPPQGITRTQSAGVREGMRQPHQHQHHPIHHPHDGVGDDATWQTRTMPNRSSTVDAPIRMHRPVMASHSERGDLDYEDASETASQISTARTEPPPERSTLPRFSDIEAGRIAVSPEVMALPPPPSYLDTFTQSGRLLDDVFSSVRVARGSPPPSDSASVVSDDHRPVGSSLLAHEASPFGAALPPPPQYTSVFTPPPAPPSRLQQQPTTRLQELRQQYIEAQRKRNAMTPFNGTVMSSYSDLDDSDVMRHRQPGVADGVAGAGPAPALAPLPLPELWVHWRNGPLGITFKRKNGQIVVSRLTGAGSSAGIEQLRAGDWLVSFNSYSTENLRLSETMELLKRLPKPIDMRFIVQ